MLQHNNNKEVWLVVREDNERFSGEKDEFFSRFCGFHLLPSLTRRDSSKQANSDICNPSQSHGCWLGVHYSGGFLSPQSK